ncbi:hypothetical protein [Gemmatimonas sp.]|jgi:hypothetical protein|uniref:hypothetical protein n=1 Tax=Gemmatimonas sp. TaxID=1962908 RepID=UPI0037BE30ED
MQPSSPHLAGERLAAFDETPLLAGELAHLAACAECRTEYEAVVEVVAMAGALGAQLPSPDAPRLVEFDAILAGVGRSEGALAGASWATGGQNAAAARYVERPGANTPAATAPRRVVASRWRQAAAALLLVSGGAVLGRVTSLAAPTGASVALAGAGSDARRASATPVSLAARPFADATYGSVEQATIALNEAQREYERASLWLASNDTTMRDPEVFRARLAALDQMMEASRVALRDAPQDPVLNHYYLAAYSAREATLQALSSALPVDKIIERY